MMAGKKSNSLAEELREAILRENAKPSKNQIQSMIEHGSINEKGEVLLKSPWTEATKSVSPGKRKRSKDA